MSTKMPLVEMMAAYETKYQSWNPTMVLKALNYHNDINMEEKVEMNNGNYHWKYIEKRLSAMMSQPKLLFKESPDFKPKQELRMDPGQSHGKDKSRGISR